MFSRITKDVTFYLKREEWKFALNEDNFKYKPGFVLDRYQKKWVSRIFVVLSIGFLNDEF